MNTPTPNSESRTQLTAKLAQAAQQVTVGARYRHYKNQTYTVIGLALREANSEPCVIYRADYDQNLTWIRPVANWIESVTVDGATVPRFVIETTDS